ncbi:MAG: hypothetical protein COB24_06630 [Hyphomicrobiales bacterium]|nr:MAG: hypothetical protein COB24_06630 [Hyphomicrobiales bacterium]
MTEKQAIHRYYKMALPAMGLYIISIAIAVWARDGMTTSESIFNFWSQGNTGLAKAVYYALAVIPIIAIGGMAWAHWRFITELDEYMRMIQIKALLIGLLCMLAMATGWGMIEMLLRLPALPIFWLVPIFWLGFSVSLGFIKAKEKGFGHEE